MDEFIKDRNEAFTSMDKDKIIEYCKKYDVFIPENEEVFWAGVHKTVCGLFLIENSPISPAQFNKSHKWLIDHGYDPLDFGGKE